MGAGGGAGGALAHRNSVEYLQQQKSMRRRQWEGGLLGLLGLGGPGRAARAQAARGNLSTTPRGGEGGGGARVGGEPSKAKSKRKSLIEEVLDFNTTESLREGDPDGDLAVGSEHRFMINPLSRFKLSWDIFTIAIAILNGFLVPYHIALLPEMYCTQQEEKDLLDFESINSMCYPRSSMYVDICIYFLYFMDLVVRFRTGFVNAQSKIVMDSRKAAVSYLSSWFLVDFLTVLPVDMFLAYHIPGGFVEIKLVQMLKMLKITELTKIVDKTPVANTFRVIRVMFSLLLLGHVIGCIYFYLGRYQIEHYANDGCNRSTGCPWIINENLVEANRYTQYASAMYWGMTMLTSVEFGDVSPNTNVEKFYAASCQLLGAICTALVFGEVAAMIQNAEGGNRRYRELIASTNVFLQLYDFPEQLRKRVRNTIEYSYTLHSGVETKELLETLPTALRAEVLGHVQRNVTQKCKLFERCSRNFVKAVSLEFEPMFFLPSEIIYETGDASRSIYFISRGIVNIMQPDGDLKASLRQGEYFGEVCYFEQVKRYETAQSKSYVELYFVTGEKMDKILQRYPESRPLLQSTAIDDAKIRAKGPATGKAKLKNIVRAMTWLKGTNSPGAGVAGMGGLLEGGGSPKSAEALSRSPSTGLIAASTPDKGRLFQLPVPPGDSAGATGGDASIKQENSGATGAPPPKKPSESPRALPSTPGPQASPSPSTAPRLSASAEPRGAVLPEPPVEGKDYGSLGYLRNAHKAARDQAEALQRLHTRATAEERRLAAELRRLEGQTGQHAPALAEPPAP